MLRAMVFFWRRISRGRDSLALLSAVFLLFALPGCGYKSLKDFATANSVERGGSGGSGNADPTAILVPDSIIRSGSIETKGATGMFKQLLVGKGDTVFLEKPIGVHGRGKYLYIVDADARLVIQVDLETKLWKLFPSVGVQFAGTPGKIFVDDDYSFYIVDADAKRVLKFSKNGRLESMFSSPANLSRPIDVSVVKNAKGEKEVWVADGSYSHIVRFDMNGQALSLIGQRGTGIGRFRAITGFSVVNDDEIYVVDRLEFPVQVLDIQGKYKYHFGERELRFPTSIVVLQQYAFVSDKLDNTIYVYQAQSMVSKVGGTGSAPGRFREVTSMWSDGEKLYIADSLNKRVQVMRIQAAIPKQKPELNL